MYKVSLSSAKEKTYATLRWAKRFAIGFVINGSVGDKNWKGRDLRMASILKPEHQRIPWASPIHTQYSYREDGRISVQTIDGNMKYSERICSVAELGAEG